MWCESDFKVLKRQGYTASQALVFLFLRDGARCNEDQRVACAPRYVAEQLDFSEKVVRLAIQKLADGGWISVNTKARRYTMARILKGAEKTNQKGAEKIRLNQYVFDEMGAAEISQKGATGVSGCTDVYLGVDTAVVLPVIEPELQQGIAARKSAPPPPRVIPAQRPPEPPAHIAPMTAAIDATHRAMKGKPYVFKSWEIQQLSRYAAKWGIPYLIALWESAVLDRFCLSRGLSVAAFFAAITRLQDGRGIQRRAAAIEALMARGPLEIKSLSFAPEAAKATWAAPATETAYVEPTDADLRDMHIATIQLVGRCRAVECRFCAKTENGALGYYLTPCTI